MEKFRETLAKILTAENTIFSVQFIKKDGSVRKMKARLKVKKGVKGKTLTYNPIDKGLLRAFDMGINEWRTINLKTVTKLQIKGEELV